MLAASRAPLDTDLIVRLAAGSAFPCRIVHDEQLTKFMGGASAFYDDEAEGSPKVVRGLLHFE